MYLLRKGKNSVWKGLGLGSVNQILVCMFLRELTFFPSSFETESRYHGEIIREAARKSPAGRTGTENAEVISGARSGTTVVLRKMAAAVITTPLDEVLRGRRT